MLARLKRARRRVPRAPEPADLGTAYGMECSLDPLREADSPARADAPLPPNWFERLFTGKPQA
jgi:hypothetical protein